MILLNGSRRSQNEISQFTWIAVGRAITTRRLEQLEIACFGKDTALVRSCFILRFQKQNTTKWLGPNVVQFHFNFCLATCRCSSNAQIAPKPSGYVCSRHMGSMARRVLKRGREAVSQRPDKSKNS